MLPTVGAVVGRHLGPASDCARVAKLSKVPLDRESGCKALHVVSAWASEHRLVLGQLKVADKSNEITAIPALLELLDKSGLYHHD